jgi:hypothetical protein
VLLGDQRGMVFVLTLPVAAVLVLALWYVARVGDAILVRERLQDAADATAFESAVMHARGMNALVLLNLIAKELQAVEPALVSISGPGTAALPATANSLEIVHELERAVAAATPVLASIVAVEDNTLFYREQGAARGVNTVSHALLPTALDALLMLDRERPWQLAPRDELAGPRLSGPDLPSLPVERDQTLALRVWAPAANGSAAMQVWAWAEQDSRQKSPFAGLAVAQAEFYYACEPTRADWGSCAPDALGSLDWTARMRRFWSPASGLALGNRRLHESFELADALLRNGLRQLGVRRPNQAADARSIQEMFELLAGEHPDWIH